MTILTLTSKAQVTLKKELQRHLNVGPGDQIEVVALPDGKLEISAVKPKQEGGLEAFFSNFKNEHNIHLTLDELEDAIADGWASGMRLDDDN
jgi:bifunctional DNA-binding transcriptional regulator/antitoxin component of YhaV-PrlF toxin-antitoxin module